MFRNNKGNDKKLLEKIEDQEQKIVRYETRLRDVVQAYKSLQKEKDALESTVKALSSSPSQDGWRKTKKSDNQSKRVDPLTASPSKDLNNESDSETQERDQLSTSVSQIDDTDIGAKDCADSEEIDYLNEKISTLSKALATVTEEKSKMEAAFQADKKLAIQEQEKRLRESEEHIETLETKNTELEKTMQELKSRVRQQQLELQSEQENNAVMLKEMQQLVSSERLEKEELKIRLQERREGDKNPESKRAYESKIENLSEELTKVSTKLKKFEDTSHQPSDLLLQISDEMTGLKKHHSEALRKEQKRANQAEEALKRFSTMEEERIAQLETKLTELSDIVGNYEKVRYQDQLVIQQLKERLALIDAPHVTLPKQSSLASEMDGNNQISDLKDQVLKLKGLLRFTWNGKEDDLPNQLATEPITVAELDNILHNDPTHRACQLEYRQLKGEFENYKMEMKNMKFNDKPSGTGTQEFSIIKQKSEDLAKELSDTRSWFDDKEKDYIETISNLQCDVTEIGERHKKEMDNLKEIHRLGVFNLEEQITRQRDRTLQLLAEKDSEISRLKGSEISSPTDKRIFQYDNDRSMQAVVTLPGQEEIAKRSVETEVAVRQLLTRQNSAGSEGSLVYYMQQMNHLQNEIVALRSRNTELESLLRDDEHREEQFLEQMNTLKAEIRRLERNRSRENANLEYIKNIVLRYILSDSYSVKLQLTTTIATILQFSPKEVNEIQKKQSGWWSSSQ